MSLTSCKRLSILFINFCILISVAQAQDSTKQVAPTPKKIVSPQKSKATTAKPKARVATPVLKSTSDTSKTTAVISTPTVRVPQDRSLNGQYNDLIKYSWLQKNYRVLNSAKFNTLWKSVNDSVSYYKKSLAETNEKLAEQTLKFNNVQSSKNSKYNPSSNTSQPVKEIQVLGTSVDTTTYNWIMLGIIFALTFTLAIILFFISKNGSDSKLYKQQYTEINEEYLTYKAKANEKEKRLARELQTERNTIEELKLKREEEMASRKTKKGGV